MVISRDPSKADNGLEADATVSTCEVISGKLLKDEEISFDVPVIRTTFLSNAILEGEGFFCLRGLMMGMMKLLTEYQMRLDAALKSVSHLKSGNSVPCNHQISNMTGG